jgi:hypothetical protein
MIRQYRSLHPPTPKPNRISHQSLQTKFASFDSTDDTLGYGLSVRVRRYYTGPDTYPYLPSPRPPRALARRYYTPRYLPIPA